MVEITLEDAVKQYNDNHKKDLIAPASKTASLDILAYAMVDSDHGPEVNSETYETVHVDLKVYLQANFKNSFIATRRSKKKDTNYELQILHLLFNGPERGTCTSFVKLGDCEAEGIEVTMGKPTKVTEEVAQKLYSTGNYLLRVKRGKRYESPPVQVFNYGME